MTQSLDRPQVKTEALSFADRVTIASVLTWNEAGTHVYGPDEIEKIRIVQDMVSIKLSGKRHTVMCRYMFRSILEAIRAAAAKQIEGIIAAEEQEVLEAEREMSDIIYQEAQRELEIALGLPKKYDWLTEPIGTDTDYISGMTGEQQAEYLPPVENAYHDENWTSEGCEF